MNKALKFILGAAIALTIAVTAFAAGVLVDRMVDIPGALPSVNDAAATPEQAAREVRDIINREALVPSADASMSAGVVRGMLESLEDSYAVTSTRSTTRTSTSRPAASSMVSASRSRTKPASRRS